MEVFCRKKQHESQVHYGFPKNVELSREKYETTKM